MLRRAARLASCLLTFVDRRRGRLGESRLSSWWASPRQFRVHFQFASPPWAGLLFCRQDRVKPVQPPLLIPLACVACPWLVAGVARALVALFEGGGLKLSQVAAGVATRVVCALPSMTLLLHRLLRFEQLQLRLWGVSAPISAPSASSCLQGLGFNSSYFSRSPVRRRDQGWR